VPHVNSVSICPNDKCTLFLLAGCYTLLEQTALESFVPLCQQRRIGVFLGGVFNSGILATGAGSGATYNYDTAPPQVQERVRRIAAVCERHGTPLATAALQFPLAHPAVAAVAPHLSVIMPRPPWAGLWVGDPAAWDGRPPPRARAGPGNAEVRPWSRGDR